MQGEISLSLLR